MDGQRAKSLSRQRGLPPIAHVLPWAYGLILAVPLYFLLVSGFKSNSSIFNAPFALPNSLDFSNFTAAWGRAGLGMGLVNSVLTTLGAEVLTLLLAIPASYAIARARGRAGGVLERIFALGLLIPAFAALVPTLLLSVYVGLFHTRTFFVLFQSAAALPLTVILLAQFMRAVPVELEESARIDGAGRLTVLLRIYLPIIVPGMVSVVILNFLSFWNEYLFALVLIGPDPDLRTVQVALPNLATQTDTQYAVLLAGCLITMVPVYVVYIAIQRRFEDALTQGAVKG